MAEKLSLIAKLKNVRHILQDMGNSPVNRQPKQVKVKVKKSPTQKMEEQLDKNPLPRVSTPNIPRIPFEKQVATSAADSFVGNRTPEDILQSTGGRQRASTVKPQDIAGIMQQMQGQSVSPVNNQFIPQHTEGEYEQTLKGVINKWKKNSQSLNDDEKAILQATPLETIREISNGAAPGELKAMEEKYHKPASAFTITPAKLNHDSDVSEITKQQYRDMEDKGLGLLNLFDEAQRTQDLPMMRKAIDEIVHQPEGSAYDPYKKSLYPIFKVIQAFK